MPLFARRQERRQIEKTDLPRARVAVRGFQLGIFHAHGLPGLVHLGHNPHCGTDLVLAVKSDEILPSLREHHKRPLRGTASSLQ